MLCAWLGRKVHLAGGAGSGITVRVVLLDLPMLPCCLWFWLTQSSGCSTCIAWRPGKVHMLPANLSRWTRHTWQYSNMIAYINVNGGMVFWGRGIGGNPGLGHFYIVASAGSKCIWNDLPVGVLETRTCTYHFHTSSSYLSVKSYEIFWLTPCLVYDLVQSPALLRYIRQQSAT